VIGNSKKLKGDKPQLSGDDFPGPKNVYRNMFKLKKEATSTEYL
jgi:hypothetical protein